MNTPLQQSTVSILSDLIGYASISDRSNLDVVSYIEDVLRRSGIASRRIANASGDKASILATIGPADRPGIVLSAHTDVVPVEGQAWSTPPFTASRSDDRLVGRGSTDMKGFIASVLANVDLFARAATVTPVHLAFSYDEELGCLGAPDLVAAITALPARPAMCIVGEPTGLAVVRAHKGKVARRITMTGRGGHSSMPHRGANAVVAAARFVERLAARGEQLAQIAGQGRERPTLDPPYTTLHVGSLHGGSALNFIPDRAIIEFEIRFLPGTDVAKLLAEIDAELDSVRADLKRQAPEAAISVETITDYPAFATPPDHPVIAAAARLADAKSVAGAVSFGTEAGFYAAAGIPTVVCGPGDIARAHKPDEWIGLEELAAADRMMQRLADRLGEPIDAWLGG
jgi:acetylornithine deacetylase